MTHKDVPQEVKDSVSAYLMARAYSETMRAAVDEIERAILKECPLTNGLETKRGMPAKEITDPKHVYLCTDKTLTDDYYAEVNQRVRVAGLKSNDMPDTQPRNEKPGTEKKRS